MPSLRFSDSYASPVNQWLLWGVAGFYALGFLVVWLGNLNTEAFYWLNLGLNAPNAPIAPEFWIAFTHYGDALVALVPFCLLLHRRPDLVLGMLLGGLICTLIIQGMKFGFNLPRPLAVLDPETVANLSSRAGSRSFPSGHAATGTLVMAVWAMLLPRWWWLIGCAAIGFLVALSRVTVAVHWPMDIFFGGMVGWVCGFLGVRWVQMKKGFNARDYGWKLRFGLTLFMAIVPIALISHRFSHSDYALVEASRWYLVALSSLGVLLAIAGLVVQKLDPGQPERPKLAPHYLMEVLRSYTRRYSILNHFLKFGLVGGSGFIVDISVYYACQLFFGIDHLTARAIAFWFAVTWNWNGNRNYTFKDRPRYRRLPQWTGYAILGGMAFVLNWGTYALLTQTAFFYEYKLLALVCGVAAGTLLNFFGARNLIFKPAKLEQQ